MVLGLILFSYNFSALIKGLLIFSLDIPPHIDHLVARCKEYRTFLSGSVGPQYADY